MHLKEKAEGTSNRLLAVRGHLVSEAEVIYIYLSPFVVYLSLWGLLLIHFPCPQVLCEFKQVTFQGQADFTNI